MLYLAIDQHRKHLTTSSRNEDGDVILRRQVSTEWPRVRAFLEEIQERSRPEGGFVTILEVCGFNDWLLKLLRECGCREVVLIQPEKRSQRKTDRRDANALGELLWVNRHRLLAGQRVQNVRRVLPPGEQEASDRQLTALRQRLGQLRTRTINRVQHLLLKHNLQQECPTKGIQTKAARKWLTALQLSPIDRLEMDLLLAQWKLWNEQLEQMDEEMKRRHMLDETSRIIGTMPGAGAFGSLALASRIGPIDRFPRAGSLPNYWGLTPRCRNSGDVTDRLGSITKQGSHLARFILAQLVMHVLHHDGTMRAWYGRIKKRRGSKIARVAVMRRLATIIWHMVKHKEPYIVGGPARLRPKAESGAASARARQKGAAPPASAIASAPGGCALR